MKIWIIISGESDFSWERRYTAAGFARACRDAAGSGVRPIQAKARQQGGRLVYVSPRRDALETARHFYPEAELLIEPLLDEIPEAPRKDTDAALPLWLWRRMAALQRRRGAPRQPESRKAAIGRAEALLDRLEAEEKECVLISHPRFVTELLDRLRIHGWCIKRSGMLQVRPLELLVASRRDEHCGVCSHNCFLSNPGCDIGRDKAALLARKGK